MRPGQVPCVSGSFVLENSERRDLCIYLCVVLVWLVRSRVLGHGKVEALSTVGADAQM